MIDQPATGESKASREAALLDARKNHAAAEELLSMYADKPGVVARAEKSRDHFAALITQLEGECPP